MNNKKRKPSPSALRRQRRTEELIRRVAREVGRECALAVFSAQADAALSLLEEEQSEEQATRLANKGALLMLENLSRAGALRYGFSDVVLAFVAAQRNGAGGVQVLSYGDVKLYPVEPLD